MAALCSALSALPKFYLWKKKTRKPRMYGTERLILVMDFLKFSLMGARSREQCALQRYTMIILQTVHKQIWVKANLYLTMQLSRSDNYFRTKAGIDTHMGNFESFNRMAPPRLLTQHDNKQKERPAHLGSVLAITCTSPAAIPVPIPAAPARCSTVSGAQPSLQPQPTQPYVICSPFFHPNKEEKPSFPPVPSTVISRL